MNKIRYIKSVKVIENEEEKIAIKKEPETILDTYNILSNRKFEYYLTPIERKKDYEIYPFINEIEMTASDKSTDIIYIMSNLHNKTTSYELITTDEIKKIYEETIDIIDNKYNYYLKIQDEYEKHIIMTPSELLLMKNISKIYYMLKLARENIEQFYKNIENVHHIRKVQSHGNISLDHLLESDNKYLISWSKSKKDFPIMDLLIFYKKNYKDIDIKSLFDEYNKKYQLMDVEKYLFFSLINIPENLNNKNDIYLDTIEVRNLVEYIDKTISFTLEENKENQKTN